MLDSVIKANRKYYPQSYFNNNNNNNNKSLLVCVNHPLLGFCLHQSV